MKKVFSLSVLLLLIVGIVAAVSAQTFPDGGDAESNAIIQNLATGAGEDAAIVVEYYAEDGTLEYTNTSVTIAPKAVVEVKTADEPLPAGFSGSAIVSSDRPVGAVTSLRNSNVSGAADGITQAAYNGASAAVDTLYFPSFWAFEFIVTRATVQNTSDAPADIELTFFDRNGNNLGTVSDTLAAHASRTFCGCDSSDLPAGWNVDDGSITVTTDDGAVLAGASVSAWANRAAGYQALTDNDRGTTLYSPSAFRYKFDTSASLYTLFSALNIQNTSSTDSAPVTVEFFSRDDGSLSLTINETIPPGTTLGLNAKNGGDVDASTFDPLTESWDGTVLVTSDDGIDLVGTGVTNWEDSDKGGMTALPSGNQATETIFVPAQYRLDFGGGWAQWSSINLQNVGTSTIAAADLSIEYIDTDGNTIATFSGSDLPFDLEAGAGIGLNTRNGGDLNASQFDSFGLSFIGGAYITAPAGSELVATSNIIYSNRASVYSGIGQ